MYYDNHLRKLSVLHKLGLRVVLVMRRVMKMMDAYDIKCESGHRQ